MLYTFVFLDTNKSEQVQVVGPRESIFQLANAFEKLKREFKISDYTGALTQQNMGWGGFQYWVTSFDPSKQ
jgi:hypothetical protein